MAHSVDVRVFPLQQWIDSTQGIQIRDSLEAAIEQLRNIAFSHIGTVHDAKKLVKQAFKNIQCVKEYIQSGQDTIAHHQDLKDQVQVLEDRTARAKMQLTQESNQLKALTEESASVQSRLHFLENTLVEVSSKLESSVDYLVHLSNLIAEKKKRVDSIRGQLKSIKRFKPPQKTILRINENGYTRKELIRERKLLNREIRQLEGEKSRANDQVIRQNKSQTQEWNPQLSSDESKGLLKEMQELKSKRLQIDEEIELAKANIDILERVLPQQRQELEKIYAQLEQIGKQEEKISRAQFTLSELEFRAQKIWGSARQIIQITQGYKDKVDLSAIIQMIDDKIRQLQMREQIKVEGSELSNEWLHAAASFLYYLSYVLLVYVVGGSVVLALSPVLLLGYLAFSLVKNQESPTS